MMSYDVMTWCNGSYLLLHWQTSVGKHPSRKTIPIIASGRKMKCSVLTCKNQQDKKHDIKNVSFFRFPNDPQLKEKWITFCQRPLDWEVNENCRICSVSIQLHYKLLQCSYCYEYFSYTSTTRRTYTSLQMVEDCLHCRGLFRFMR